MSASRIEHVNLTVSNPEATAAMLCALFDWKIRWQGPSQMGGRTVHVGTDEDYLAVYTKAARGSDDSFTAASRRGLNHIGIVVDDLAEIEARVRAAGLAPCNFGDYEPGRRFYFDDPDGIEYEVVSYA